MNSYNDLYHTGVLGMRWGHRKDSSSSWGQPKQSRDKTPKPNAKTMSDEELQRRVNRLQKERQYSQLTSTEISKGQAAAKNAMKVVTVVAAATTTGLTLYGNAGRIKTILETTSKSQNVSKAAAFAAKHINRGVDKDIAGALMKF